MKVIRERSKKWRARRARKFERRSETRRARILQRSRKLMRARHREGEKRLAQLFDGPARPFNAGLQHGRAKPIRLRPGVPPVRDAEHTAKHRKRKIARASRKRNRA